MTAYIYLRKSREDIQYESNTGIDTLARHREALLEYAEEADIEILGMYEEVVSGEKIITRPEMVRLLRDIENQNNIKPDSVLCFEIDRLGRGNLKDIGIILETLEENNTLIITPDRKYNLTDEDDYELVANKLITARNELKAIKKRLSKGRLATIKRGGYLWEEPFGYDRDIIYGEGKPLPTLKINPIEAPIVQEIYNLYINGQGSQLIAYHVNKLGVKTKTKGHNGKKGGKEFTRNSIRFILQNETYTGKIVYNRTQWVTDTKTNKRKVRAYNTSDKWLLDKDGNLPQGRHPAIITEEIFNKAKEIRLGKNITPCNHGQVSNPLSGLIYCNNCGYKMQMQRQNAKKDVNGEPIPPHVLCTKKGCIRGTRIDHIESRVLDQLRKVLGDKEFNVKPPEDTKTKTSQIKSAIKRLEDKLPELENRRTAVFDAFERGDYTSEEFRSRKENADNNIEECKLKIKELKAMLPKETISPKQLNKQIKKVLDNYESWTAEQKNQQLKKLVRRITYNKTKEQWGNKFDLEIELNI